MFSFYALDKNFKSYNDNYIGMKKNTKIKIELKSYQNILCTNIEKDQEYVRNLLL